MRPAPTVTFLEVTYDPGRDGGGRAPVLRSDWREPLRAQRDPLADDLGRVRSNRDGRPHPRKRTWLGRFVSTYGWRAYALPILTAVTVIWAYQAVTGTGEDHQGTSKGPVEGPRQTIDAGGTAIVGAPPEGAHTVRREPAHRRVARRRPVHRGRGQDVAHRRGTEQQVGQGTTREFCYTVEVEDGIDTTAYGGDEGFALMVSQTLGNPKSWTHNPQFAFRRIDSGNPDFHFAEPRRRQLREAAATRSSWRAPATTRPMGRTRSGGCSSTRPAGCAARFRSRATSAHTGNT